MRNTVLTRVIDEVAVVTLNDPGARNAISLDMREQLLATLGDHIRDGAVKAIVLEGADGNFCSGGNISHLKANGYQPDAMASWSRIGRLHDLIRLVATAPKPVVAAVEGAAYGAGVSLALACDWIVAARDARFCAMFGRLSMIADAGLIWSLPQRVGPGRARELLMTSRRVSGEEALELGLSDELGEAGDATALAVARARAMGQASPLVVAATKAMFAMGLDDVMKTERFMQPMLLMTEDHRRGREAVAQKRAPTFRGR